jgi:chorismate mutase/prephenate dehydratase
LSREEALSAIRRLYTMPQATAQCRSWLSRSMRGVEQVDVSTTARAAELAAAEPGTAAIAGRAAAEHYGLNILADKIEDNPHNRTRFLILGANQPPPTGQDKTSILFSVRHEAGALTEALSIFAKHRISLTMIESRPTRQTPGEYVFFVDVLGHVAGEGERAALRKALPELEQRCLFVKLLGSYPEA